MKHLALFARSAAFKFVVGALVAIGLALVLRWLVAHSPAALSMMAPRTLNTPFSAMLIGELVLLCGAPVAALLLSEEKPGMLSRHRFASAALGFLLTAIPAYGFLVFASEPSVWIRVQHQDSISAYRHFLNRSPDSAHSSSAMNAIRRLERDWLSSNSHESLAARVLSLVESPTRRVAVLYMPDHAFERETPLRFTHTTADNYRYSMNAFKQSTSRLVLAFAHSLSSDVIDVAEPKSAPGETIRLEVGYSARYGTLEYEWFGDSGAGRITPIAVYARVAIFGPAQAVAAHEFEQEFYPDARPNWSGQMEMHNVLADNVVAKATAVLQDVLAPLP